MPRICVICNGEERTINASAGARLSDVLIANGIYVEHPCGGRGSCKKCEVLINGKTELSCLYTVEQEIVVRISDAAEMRSVSGAEESGGRTENTCLCLDIGSTTLAMALVSLEEGKIVKVITKTNPQCAFGADVISRIEFAAKNGTEPLSSAVREAINGMIDEIERECGNAHFSKMYVSGNATMLHLLLDVDCASMGVAPYTPCFTDAREVSGGSIGLERVDRISLLPSVSAFVGADIVAGMNQIGMPSEGKYALLIDLGTNAEVVLYGKEVAYATAAAAGPCFEGANIFCGMSAVPGAISSFYRQGIYQVIGNTEPIGICATGLVDVVSYLLKSELVDQNGVLEDGEFRIADRVTVTQEDIRAFQLAKAAVSAAIQCLLAEAGITHEDVEAMYVAGGFSAGMDRANAAYVGLFPRALTDRFVAVNNTSLLGTVRYAVEGNDLTPYTENTTYVDLSSHPKFTELFLREMRF